MEYVHGYDQRENIRLQDQASSLVELLHSDTSYPARSQVLEAGCAVRAEVLELMAEILTKGELNHPCEPNGQPSWQLVEEKAYEDALFRHFQAYRKGEMFDERMDLPSGKPCDHMGNIAVNAMFLWWFNQQGGMVDTASMIEEVPEKGNIFPLAIKPTTEYLNSLTIGDKVVIFVVNDTHNFKKGLHTVEIIGYDGHGMCIGDATVAWWFYCDTGEAYSGNAQIIVIKE